MMTYRQHQALQRIGSRYHGPDLQRPALRQMPREWVLEGARKPKRLSPDAWVLIACGLGWVFAFAQTCLELAQVTR